MKLRRWAVVAVAILAVAGCAGAEDEAAGDAPATEAAVAVSEPAVDDVEDAETEPAEAGAADDAGTAVVEVTSSDLGDILVDGEGMTLYVFDSDTDGTSTCYDDCAANWPPLAGDVSAGDGIDESLLGTTERDDGETQVTYADQPLYYFAADQSPGDTNGQAVGDVWWVVSPEGESITGEAESASNTTSGY